MDVMVVSILLEFLLVPFDVSLAEMQRAVAGKSGLVPCFGYCDQASTERYSAIFPIAAAADKELPGKMREVKRFIDILVSETTASLISLSHEGLFMLVSGSVLVIRVHLIYILWKRWHLGPEFIVFVHFYESGKTDLVKQWGDYDGLPID